MIGLEVSVLVGYMEYTNVIVDDNQIGAMNAGEVESGTYMSETRMGSSPAAF